MTPSRRFTAPLLLACVTLVTAGCASTTGEDGADGSASDLSSASRAGVLYFHGMSHVGIDPKAIQDVVDGRDLSTPRLSDAELQAPIGPSLLSFLQGHETDVVGGYSLGRVAVFRLMKGTAPRMTRVVMIDPTFDSAAGMGQSIGGPIAKAWLSADDRRTFMLVYGDETKSLKGDESYVTSLAGEARAELCFIAGDHARFAKADMAFALVAKDCADLEGHLDP